MEDKMRRRTRLEARHPARHGAPRLLVCAAATAGLLAWVVTPATAEARTITADQFLERQDIGGTAGCTLREAIQAINLRTNVNGCLAGDGNNDTIKLVQAAAYDVRLAVAADTLTITRPLTIAGSGVDAASIIRPKSGAGHVTLFVITSPGTVTIQGVIIRDIPANALTVNSGASARLFFSWILDSGTSAPSTPNSGAVRNDGALTVSGVEFSGCRGWLSGGLFNTGSVYIEDSSFVGGDASRTGALVSQGSAAWAYVVNTTFGKNLGNNQPSAISNFGGGTMELNGVTVFNNRSAVSSAALYNESPGTFKIKTTFISSNTNNGTGNPNCSGPITSLGYNYLGVSNRCQPVVTQLTDVWGGTEGMAATGTGFPVRQGGLTRVYVPQPGGMAVAQVPESECLASDQRGLGRKDGSNCEIGAVNRAHATLVVGNASAPAAEDVQMASWLQALGFDIYFHDDSSPAAQFFNIGLTIGIISTTVSDTTVGTKYKDAPTGFVVNKISALDNMEMVATNAYGTFTTGQAVTVPVATDYFHLLIGNAGATSINNGGGGWGTPAGTASTTYVTYNFNSKPAIFRFNPGAAADGGYVLPGGRIAFPGWPSFFTGSGTTVGKNMFFEAVFWASRNRRL
jgi:hypothetical protein